MNLFEYTFWNNTVATYLIAVAIILAGWVVAGIVSKILKRFVISKAEDTESRVDDLIAGVGVKPIFWLVFLAGLHAGVNVIKIPEWLDQLIWPIFVVAWTVVCAAFLVRFLNGLFVHYIERFAADSELELLGQVIRMIRSVVGIAVWIMAGLFIIGNLGFNVSSLLAGLGLGGLALAMASKDTLANLFVSFTILVNGPFKVGEAVKYQGHTGTVEEVGLRATKIRTYDGHLVSIPNSLAPTSVVENISRRPRLRVLFKLGLEYGTSNEKIDQAVELVKKAVEAEDGTAQDPLVHFVDFGESALDVQVIYYIEDSSRILDIKHSVNSRIKESLEKAEIGIAFNTLTVIQEK
jgi:MscS family membrane protein